MIFLANDVCTRAALAKLLVKIENDPEFSEQIGVKDMSHFRCKAAKEEKEVKNHVELDVCHSDYGGAF